MTVMGGAAAGCLDFVAGRRCGIGRRRIDFTGGTLAARTARAPRKAAGLKSSDLWRRARHFELSVYSAGTLLRRAGLPAAKALASGCLMINSFLFVAGHAPRS